MFTLMQILHALHYLHWYIEMKNTNELSTYMYYPRMENIEGLGQRCRNNKS